MDSMDEEKIEEYLKRQGISSMQETGPKKIVRDTNYRSSWETPPLPDRAVLIPEGVDEPVHSFVELGEV